MCNLQHRVDAINWIEFTRFKQRNRLNYEKLNWAKITFTQHGQNFVVRYKLLDIFFAEYAKDRGN